VDAILQASRAQYSTVTQIGVAEILNRRRALTLPMIRALSRLLDLPADVLTQAYEVKRAA
jgi:antitoxin component HigA of HigAB toxin-antitoxin module